MARWWPLIRLLPQKTNFHFVRFSGVAAIISLALVVASFASILSGGFTRNPIETLQKAGPTISDKAQAIFCTGFNCSVDFKGGVLLELRTEGAADLAALRAAVTQLDLRSVQVQRFGEVNQVLVRFELPEGAQANAVGDRVGKALSARFPGLVVSRLDVVGAKVSGELFQSGLTALGLAILLMLIYIWFRFELNYGIGAVTALFHDIILTMGLLSVLQIEFSLTTIAALLTIIGYSMNDTVVVFDRMRENRRKFKKMSWAELIDLSVNETLSRTIITGLTAFLALGGLMLFGGPTMFPFVFAMIFGIAVGTYSSIYVAAPAMLLYSRDPSKVGASAPTGPSIDAEA